MARDPHSDRPSLDPQVVATQTFSTTFRGFDTSEVRGYLETLAGLMTEAEAREEDLTRRLAEAEERLANPPPLDEHELTVLLGEETTRVIEAARAAATEIRTKSEENAARLVREASDEATATTQSAEEYAARLRSEADAQTSEQRTAADEYAAQVRGTADEEIAGVRAAAEADAARMREEAETILAVRTEEAENAVVSVRMEAARVQSDTEDELANLRASTMAELAELRAEATAQADAEIEAARQDGREMVTEARAVRGRMLTDLADRRRAGRGEIDKLRATRQWLIEMLESARRRLDEAGEDLAGSVPTGRLAAEDLAADETARQEAEDDAALEELINHEPVRKSERERAMADELEAEREPDVVAEAATGGVPPDASPAVEPVVDPALEPVVEPAVGEIVIDPAPVTVTVEPAEPVAATGEAPADEAAVPVADLDTTIDLRTGADEPVEGGSIDALFAKIRASRADEVERAQEVLADVSGTTGTAEPAATSPSTIDQPDHAPPADDLAHVPAAADAPDELRTADARVIQQQPDAVASLLERRDAATDEIERQLARRLKRILSDEQNELLDNVRRAKGLPTADTILPAMAAHADRYSAAATGDLAGAASAGAAFYGQPPANLSTRVDDIAERLADELVRQLRARLNRSFSDAEGDQTELGERIRACYREWKTQRIADTSRHFVLAAFTRGLFDAAPSATGFRWIVDDGGTPCPDAEDNALQGEVPKGEPFPTGDAYPPAHPGCRCLIVPVEVAVATSM